LNQGHEAKINEKWVLDPFMDDQGLIIKLKDKGLVVISGCAHAGIVNTVRHAQKITETNKFMRLLEVSILQASSLTL
jgi:7,8-dihydropterin-6-yl-methyl-4-(beta-D-ribofuranosyl)aminobenzene 5'-phosphate synthase